MLCCKFNLAENIDACGENIKNFPIHPFYLYLLFLLFGFLASIFSLLDLKMEINKKKRIYLTMNKSK